MGVKTAVLLALVLGVFCIGLSHGLKCYQCNSETDGGGCHKPEESFLKECATMGGFGARAGKPACVDLISAVGDKTVTARSCVPLSSAAPGCIDGATPPNAAGAGPAPTIPPAPPQPQDRMVGGAKGKVCTCYEDGCNKTQAGTHLTASVIGVAAAALLLNILNLCINY